jgi:hypothetical protein
VRAFRSVGALAVSLALGFSLLGSAPVRAAPHEAPRFHGDIGRFHEHDWAVWHGGRWQHGYHGGRLGWWWVAGGLWYFYPYPVYPYPDPYVPPVLVAQPAQPGALPPAPTPTSWYYCNSGHSYYPYVTSCPEGWHPVPANSAAGNPPAEQK